MVCYGVTATTTDCASGNENRAATQPMAGHPSCAANHRDPPHTRAWSQPHTLEKGSAGGGMQCLRARALFPLFTSLLLKTTPSFTVSTKRNVLTKRGWLRATEQAELRWPFHAPAPVLNLSSRSLCDRHSTLVLALSPQPGLPQKLPRQSPGAPHTQELSTHC